MSSRSSSNFPEFAHLLRVGFVKSAHGIRGEYFVRLFAGTADWLDRVADLHLLGSAADVPNVHRQLRLRTHKDGLLVTDPRVTSRDQAEALRGAQVYVANAELVSRPGEAIYLRELLGFAVIDATAGAAGEVTGFSSNGAQDLLVVRRPDGGRDALVPFLEVFVREIDFDKRLIRVELPRGLLTLGD